MKWLNWFVSIILLTAASLMVAGCGDKGTGPSPEPTLVVYVDVRAIPPANILIDGKSTGKTTPAIIPIPLLETCIVRVTREGGWDGWEKTVALPVTAGDTLLVDLGILKVNLLGSVLDDQGKPVKSQIIIEVFKDPVWEQAGVIENRDDDGSFNLKLLPGQYRVTAKPEGYVPVTSMITIGEDGTIKGSLGLVPKPLPTTGTVSLDSNPPGATIWVNSVEQPTRTPVDIVKVHPGTYDVRLTLEGYEDATTTLTVVAGQVTVWDVVLARIPLPIDSFPTEPTDFTIDYVPRPDGYVPGKITIWRIGNTLYFAREDQPFGTITDDGVVEMRLGRKTYKGRWYPEIREIIGEIVELPGLIFQIFEFGKR